jgi:heme/copper-type cytochrome/quinol oxidase subunit 2
MILAILHGDDLDLIYFWSSILIVALPLLVFGTLTYFVVKGYRRRGEGRS